MVAKTAKTIRISGCTACRAAEEVKTRDAKPSPRSADAMLQELAAQEREEENEKRKRSDKNKERKKVKQAKRRQKEEDEKRAARFLEAQREEMEEEIVRRARQGGELPRLPLGGPANLSTNLVKADIFLGTVIKACSRKGLLTDLDETLVNWVKRTRGSVMY